MERLSQDSAPEQDRRPSEFCVPLVDVLRDADQTSEIWPEYADQLRPQIERHVENAQKITTYLDDLERGEATMAEKNRFYEAACDLLNNPEQERIALFLPFESLPTADEQGDEAQRFRRSYLSALSDLLRMRDVRANFVDGDVLEVDARSSDPERVIKAAHLIPWLVRNGMLEESDVVMLAQDEDELLVRNVLETTELMSDLNLLSATTKTTLDQIQSTLPEQPPAAPPKYISLARQTWLAEKNRGLRRPTEPLDDVDLSAPLSRHLEKLAPELEKAESIAANLDPTQTYNVIWMGGSRLKGYNRTSSDLDLFAPTKVPLAEFDDVHTVLVDEIKRDLPNYPHEVFNMAWAGRPEGIKQLQRELPPLYFTEQDPRQRQWVTERLEQDLLEYRLLHKGYPRLHPDTNPEYKKYTAMDGQSSFYETGYRIIATKIYANSIFIPQLNPVQTPDYP